MLSSTGNPIDEVAADIPEITPLKGRFEHTSSTLWRQRQEYCARIIQQFFRKYKQRRLAAAELSCDEGGSDTDRADEDDEEEDEEAEGDLDEEDDLDQDGDDSEAPDYNRTPSPSSTAPQPYCPPTPCLRQRGSMQNSGK